MYSPKSSSTSHQRLKTLPEECIGFATKHPKRRSAPLASCSAFTDSTGSPSTFGKQASIGAFRTAASAYSNWRKSSCHPGQRAYRITLVSPSVTSQFHRYFGAYGEDILQRFFDKFEEWELQLVLEDLKKAGFTSDDTSALAGKTLSDVPSTLLYRMVANWKVFSDARIQTLFAHCLPTRIVSDWPMKSPPPGLLVLQMGESKALRDWARKQTLSCELSLLAPHQFTESYSQALMAMVAVVSSPTYASSESLLLSTEPPVVWAAFGTMLRLVPVERLMPSRTQAIDLRHVVSGHLHDTGSRKYEPFCFQ